ncbi:MAG: type III pantothenate kinase [Candidatus Gastranaerophilaceae bacterium]|nr:type III pantothenate kinase [Christensenellales bacterium]
MLLAFDIGNTNIKTGLFENGQLRYSWRLTTDLRRTSDEYGVHIESFFNHLGLGTDCVDGIIMSTVIPSINYTIEHMCRVFFRGKRLLQVDHKLETGLINRYEHPETLGSDRICNAAAAFYNYGGPCIAIDFGTATNFSVISQSGEFLGGLICPGIKISTDALIEHAAMLPKVEYNKPAKVISANTEDAIRSGIINGYVGQVDHIVDLIGDELHCSPIVVATGGMSAMIASETSRINHLNPTLTLEGLAIIYEMNA